MKDKIIIKRVEHKVFNKLYLCSECGNYADEFHTLFNRGGWICIWCSNENLCPNPFKNINPDMIDDQGKLNV